MITPYPPGASLILDPYVPSLPSSDDRTADLERGGCAAARSDDRLGAVVTTRGSAVGVAPMEYLLAWRMAVAKDLLRRHDLALAEVAERVGYGSASAFSTAFSRQVGQPPSRYARER